MGLSAPPPASIDLVGSFARRRGSDVELVLWAPTQAQHATAVELAKGASVVRGSIELVSDSEGDRLVARVARAELSDGQWSITVLTPDGERSSVEARLLVQDARPLVLLWGAKSLEAGLTPEPPAQTARKRAAQAGGRLLDSALRPLPPQRAVAARRSLRRAARRVLS